MKTFLLFFIVTIAPAVLSIVFTQLNKKTKFAELDEKWKQVIYGLSFGGLAVLGTEFGVSYNGAQMNARDGAVVTAGLIFGGPAGIIAGLIGGVERWFAVYWGIGAYTRVACTISTIIAGFYSALLRKYMFDKKEPTWQMGLACGVVIEVFHMVMVFVTNVDDMKHAMTIVAACSKVMIPINSIAVLLSIFVVKELKNVKEEELASPRILTTFQKGLLIYMILAYVISIFYVYKIQTKMADEQTSNLLIQSINDIVADVEETSDKNLLKVARNIRDDLVTKSIEEVNKNYDVAEISIIDQNGIIVDSSNPKYIGFDMSSGEQSAEFLVLLDDETEFVQQYGPITSDPNIYRKYAGVRYKYGFVQVGYNAVEFQSDIAEKVIGSATNRHIGETGYLVVCNELKVVVSSPVGKENFMIDLYPELVSCKDYEICEVNIEGKDVFATCSRAEGYYIVAALPKDEAYQFRDIVYYSNSLMLILVFALVYAMVDFLVRKKVVDNIHRVNRSLYKISGGNLDEVVDVKDNIEFVYLSKDINETVNTLKRYIKEANARIDAELEYAKEIQYSVLPHEFPEHDKYEIFALMETAKEVGGDFYDYINTYHNTLNFLIADVSGKGIPGAMFMMRAKSILHSLTETGMNVNDVFTKANESLCEGNDAGMFVTAWEGSLDLKTGLVTFANAGHNPPILKHADGRCEYLRSRAGFVLAGMEGVQYKLQELQMEKGDILYLYTDGVVEANNKNKELYGEDRLLETISKIDSELSMEYLCCEIIGNVGVFVDEAEQFDDITMLAVKYNGIEE